jgi:hypothetical protein
MFVGVKDQIVDIENNRWLRKQLKSLIYYRELEHDHFSFQLAKDMSYFDDVIRLIEEYNPLPEVTKECKIPEDTGIIYEPSNQAQLTQNFMWWVK